MKSSFRIITGVVISLVLVAVSTYLFIDTDLGAMWYTVLVILSITVAVLLALSFKRTSATDEGDCLHITAPFVDLKIPYRSIESLGAVEEMDFGFRAFGYGGIHYGSGEFTNKTLGGYTLAADERVPLLIVVAWGRTRVAFNLKTLAETEAVLELLESRAPGAARRDIPPMTEADRKATKRRNRAVAAVVAGTLAMVAVILVCSLTMGSVNVHLGDESLEIDATLMNETVRYEGITGVELRSDIGYGDRVGGLANSKVLTGNFKNPEFGKYRLAVYTSADECVIIHTVGKTVVVNQADAESTEKLYNELLKKIGHATAP